MYREVGGAEWCFQDRWAGLDHGPEMDLNE